MGRWVGLFPVSLCILVSFFIHWVPEGEDKQLSTHFPLQVRTVTIFFVDDPACLMESCKSGGLCPLLLPPQKSPSVLRGREMGPAWKDVHPMRSFISLLSPARRGTELYQWFPNLPVHQTHAGEFNIYSGSHPAEAVLVLVPSRLPLLYQSPLWGNLSLI